VNNDFVNARILYQDKLFPADTLNRAAVNRLLDILFLGAGRIKALRFSGTVETENPGAGGYAKTATDAAILVDNRFPVHSGLLGNSCLLYQLKERCQSSGEADDF
jgi:hypothetical protein